VAQAGGFDVVHPAVTVSISDPAGLAHLASGGGLQFSIDGAAAPSSIFELKVNSVELELDGASAASPTLLWIEHSGHWKMVPRPPHQGAVVEFALFPHVEVFNCSPGKGILSASIPGHAQSPSEPGPPFAFWGRGVIADFRVFPDASARDLDLSQLKALKFTFNCIGFVAQGAVQPSHATIKPASLLLPTGTIPSVTSRPALAA